jgi:hypothetical protein
MSVTSQAVSTVLMQPWSFSRKVSYTSGSFSNGS